MAKKINEKKSETDSSDFVSVEKKYLPRKNLVIWIVFLFSLSVVLITLVSVVFPALIASNNSVIIEIKEIGVIPVDVDSFVTGIWTIPLIITNIVIFVLAILYFKKRLPDSIKQSFEFIFEFEISKKVAILSVVILLAAYVFVSAQELTIEEEWEDYSAVIKRLDRWSPDEIGTKFEPHVRYFLLWSSMILFGSYRVIPLLASIALLLLTYLFTTKISGKRFAGLVSFMILLQSSVFLRYDTTVSYTNFWILLYLLSLYLVYKAWPLSPIAYFLSIASKALTAMFLPMSLFFIYRSSVSRLRKIVIISTTVGILIVGASGAIASDPHLITIGQEFNSDDFWLGFTSFSYQLRFDGLVVLFILPLIVGLFISSLYGIKHADSIMVFIGWMLIIGPLLTGFTDMTNQPYRFVPLIVFFAIGVGVLLAKKKNNS